MREATLSPSLSGYITVSTNVNEAVSNRSGIQIASAATIAVRLPNFFIRHFSFRHFETRKRAIHAHYAILRPLGEFSSRIGNR